MTNGSIKYNLKRLFEVKDWDDIISYHIRNWENTKKSYFDDFINAFKGQFSLKPRLKGYSTEAYLNIVYPVVDSIVSSLFVRNPMVNVIAMNDEGREYEKIIELKINEEWHNPEFSRIIRMVIRCMALFGVGIIKTLWQDDRVWHEVCYLNEIFWDKDVKSFNDCKYIIHRYYEDYISFSRRFPDYNPDKFPPSSLPKWAISSRLYKGSFLKKNMYLEVFEVFDFIDDKFLIFLNDGKSLFYEDNLPEEGDAKNPFTIVFFNEVPAQPEVVSDIDLIWEIQRQLNFMRSRRLESINRVQSRYIYDKDTISEEDIKKIASLKDNEFHGISLGGKLIEQVIMKMPTQEMQYDFNATEEKIFQDALYIVASPEFQRGIREGFRTATEAQMVESMLKNRVSSRQDIVDALLIPLAQKTISLYHNHFRGKEIIQHQGQKYEFTPAIFDQRYKFKIVPGSALPTTQQIRQETFLRIFPLLMQLLPLAMQNPAFIKVYEYIVREFDLPIDLLNLTQQQKTLDRTKIPFNIKQGE